MQHYCLMSGWYPVAYLGRPLGNGPLLGAIECKFLIINFLSSCFLYALQMPSVAYLGFHKGAGH